MTDSWEIDFKRVAQNLPQGDFEFSVHSWKVRSGRFFPTFLWDPDGMLFQNFFQSSSSNQPKRAIGCGITLWHSPLCTLFQPFLWHNYLQIVAKCFVFWKIKDYELSKMINFRSSIPRFSKWPIGKFNHYTPEGIKERFPPETPMLAEFDTRKTHNNFDSIKKFDMCENSLRVSHSDMKDLPKELRCVL